METLTPKTQPGRYRIADIPKNSPLAPLWWAVEGMYGELRNALGTFQIWGDEMPVCLPYGTQLAPFTEHEFEYRTAA